MLAGLSGRSAAKAAARLGTVAKIAPRNPTVIINGIARITGKQQTATAGVTDMVAVTKGAGLAGDRVRDEAHFMQLLARRFTEGGPLLLAVKIDDKPGPIQALRGGFMKGLGSVGRLTFGPLCAQFCVRNRADIAMMGATRRALPRRFRSDGRQDRCSSEAPTLI